MERTEATEGDRAAWEALFAEAFESGRLVTEEEALIMDAWEAEVFGWTP
jgi:hypothetical protein